MVAAVGCLALAESPPNNGAKREQTYRNRTTRPTLPTITQASAEAAKPNPTAEHDRPCIEGQHNRSSELCAEWQSADQAGQAAKWAARGFWLSALGILGLLYNLKLTRASTNVALDAAKDADKAIAIAAKNADAAAALVEISEKNDRIRLRAYLAYDRTIVVRHRTQPNGAWDQAHFEIFWKNVGKTPATVLDAYIGARLTPDDLPDFPRSITSTNSVVAYPNNPISVSTAPIAKDILQAVVNGSLHCFVLSGIRYTDIFGSEWNEEVCIGMRFGDLALSDSPDSELDGTVQFRFVSEYVRRIN